MTAQGSAAKPLRADALRNRAKVLAAAQEAFAAEGPGVALDEIARRAGVGAGTVYRHFPTKEALLEAVVVERIEALTVDARAALDRPDPGAVFFEFFEAMVAESGSKMDLADALSRSGVELGEATREAAATLHDAIGALLRRAQEAGAVRDDAEVEDLHSLVVGAVAAERRVGGSAGRATKLMCDALRPRG